MPKKKPELKSLNQSMKKEMDDSVAVAKKAMKDKQKRFLDAMDLEQYVFRVVVNMTRYVVCILNGSS